MTQAGTVMVREIPKTEVPTSMIVPATIMTTNMRYALVGDISCRNDVLSIAVTANAG
jgi:hypothetical protein